MMEKMIALQQKRRSKKGGFTLVELIVVLVILAILAVLLIPALTGYIDKAKNKKIVAEARQVVMAAQTLFDEDYGTGDTTDATAGWLTDTASKKYNFTKEKAAKLAEVDESHIGDVTVTKGKITGLTYTNGKKCTFANNTYTVSE